MFKLRSVRIANLILSSALFALSCGDIANSPASDDATVSFEEAVAASQVEGLTSPLARPGFIVFTPRAVAAAKRLAWRDGLVVKEDTEAIDYDRGGTLRVKFPIYAGFGDVQLASAEFKVQKRSIFNAEPDAGRDDYTITMSATSGKTLDQVVVAFDPDGMMFDPPAKLEVTLFGRIDVEELIGYHVSGDGGHVEKVRLKVRKQRWGVEIAVNVLSFSQYSWDTDD